MPVGERAVQAGFVTDQSAGGDFDLAIVMPRNAVVKGVIVNAVDSPDAIDTFELKVNGAVRSPSVLGKGTTDPANFEGEFVGIGSSGIPSTTEVAAGDLIEINHDGASTGVGDVYGGVVLDEPGPLNERVEQLGTSANITTGGAAFDVDVVITEPCIVKGIAWHTKVLTDAVDQHELLLNGSPFSPTVLFNCTDGLAADSGEFVACQRRIELIPGDRITLTVGGESTGPGAVFAAVVLGH